MAFTRFSEYLEKNGKVELQTKPIVSLDGDTSKFPKPNKPEKAAKKGKGWHLEAAVVDDDNGPLAYQGDGKDPGLQMAGDGGENSPPLGTRDVPQKGMVYHPKTDPSQKIDVSLNDKFGKTKAVNFKANAPAKTVDSAPPKAPSKTESFLNQTSKLTPEKFIEFILQKKTASEVCAVTDIANKIGNSTELLEIFVHEIKRKGNFERLMEAILNQPESYVEFALAVASDESKARIIAKTLNEATAKSASEDDEEEEEAVPNGNKLPLKKKSNILRPEQTLIQALAGYKNIRETMQGVLGG